jgi:tetratricopeptide (TPR) repeat protein
MGRRALRKSCLLLLLVGACATKRPRTPHDAGPVTAASLPTFDAAVHPSVPCPVADKADLDGSLDEAARRFEAGEFLVALACAEQAARIAPRSVEAHHDRADALVALERIDEARSAFALALALDPEDPQTLASAADFYINRLGGEHEQLLIGLEYARRGSGHAGRRREDREQAARLALLEAEALDDLARSDEALPRVEAALRMSPDNPEARYLRALVLFHLVKLERARQAFEAVLEAHPEDAYAHHHLGLILERDGRYAEAELHFARARALAPAEFSPPVLPTSEEFAAMVAQAVAALDPAARNLLGTVQLEVADLPAADDLLASDPPFPPTILGLFREARAPGADAGPGAVRDSIVLYRRNLSRAATTRAELERQVRITLLHELGHLAGADEDELRARGFE